VIDSTGLQLLFTIPYRDQLTRTTPSEYLESVENRLLMHMMVVGVPLAVGFILLGISVATVNNQASGVDPGSRMAIQASGYLPVAILGYFVIAIIVTAFLALVIRLLSLRLDATELHLGDVRLPPSALYPWQEMSVFRLGAPQYINYRRKRLARRQQ
jgi:hypothetical protein